MVVRSLLFVLQTLLLLALFALGSVLLPFLPALPVWQVSAGPGRVFVCDGLVFAAVVCALILLAEAARKRLRSAGLLTVGSFLLAMLLGLLMRFGFKSL